jgi:hypothetical protein
MALDGAYSVEVIHEKGCPSSRLQLDPTSPVQVELIEGVLPVRIVDTGTEVFQLFCEKPYLARNLASATFSAPRQTHADYRAQKHIGQRAFTFVLA